MNGNPHPELHPENLDPNLRFEPGERAREAGRKGGLVTQERARRRKTLQECAEIILAEKKLGKDGKNISGAEAMMLSMFNKALKGDVQAAKFIREVIGEDPAQKVEISGASEFGGVININIAEASKSKND